MAVYTIIRLYEVPADDRIQATERMLDSLQMHTERDSHVKDYIRAPDDKPGKGKPVDLRATGWLNLIREQLRLAVKRHTKKQ